MQRAAGENHAIFGPVRELDPLRRTGKDHGMLADHRAAAQRSKADITGTARAGHAVTAAHRMPRKIDAAALGSGAAEHQRGARWRIDLLVVMHFDDLDVVIVVERLSHALHQRRKQTDAETHIAGY